MREIHYSQKYGLQEVIYQFKSGHVCEVNGITCFGLIIT